MVGVALANNLGPLSGQVVNVLDDAIYNALRTNGGLVERPHVRFFAQSI